MPAPESSAPETLTEAGRDSLIGFVSDAITQTFDDTVYQITDLPGFVADTNPVGPFANASRQAARLVCRSYARGGGPQNLPGFDAAWGGICGPYLDSIGESPSPGSLDLPFRGGQCEIPYFVQYSYNTVNTDGSPGSTFTPEAGPILGPIRGIERRGAPGSYTAVITSGNGVESVVNSSSAPQGGLENLKITQFFVSGGGSGPDCGDPPPIYDPPRIRPGLPVVGPQPIDLPGVGPVPIEITFNPDGTLNVNLPDVNADFDIPVDIGLELGGGGDGGGGNGPPPGDVGDPGVPSDTGAGGEADGEAPEGQVLTGLRVEILAFPNSRTKYTEEVYRGAYYVYMGVPGLLDLDFGGAMVRADQFFLAEKENLTSWRVSANDGYSTRVTPYYRTPE